MKLKNYSWIPYFGLAYCIDYENARLNVMQLILCFLLVPCSMLLINFDLWFQFILVLTGAFSLISLGFIQYKTQYKQYKLWQNSEYEKRTAMLEKQTKKENFLRKSFEIRIRKTSYDNYFIEKINGMNEKEFLCFKFKSFSESVLDISIPNDLGFFYFGSSKTTFSKDELHALNDVIKYYEKYHTFDEVTLDADVLITAHYEKSNGEISKEDLPSTWKELVSNLLKAEESGDDKLEDLILEKMEDIKFLNAAK